MDIVQLVGRRQFVVFVMVVMAILAFVAPDDYRFLSGIISTPVLLLAWFVWISDVSAGVRLLMTANSMIRALGGEQQPLSTPPHPSPRPRRPIRISDPSVALDDLDDLD